MQPPVITIRHLKGKVIIMKLTPFWRSFYRCKQRVVFNLFLSSLFSSLSIVVSVLFVVKAWEACYSGIHVSYLSPGNVVSVCFELVVCNMIGRNLLK
jgi:hypothetical protein